MPTVVSAICFSYLARLISSFWSMLCSSYCMSFAVWICSFKSAIACITDSLSEAGAAENMLPFNHVEEMLISEQTKMHSCLHRRKQAYCCMYILAIAVPECLHAGTQHTTSNSKHDAVIMICARGLLLHPSASVDGLLCILSSKQKLQFHS